MSSLPMFPLGSVLFPHMPVALRVFEERYLVMLARVLQTEPSEFGVVLIERGSEVGGGEQRFEVGTVARIAQLEASEGVVGLVGLGTRRIAVERWLDDEPHPLADVRELPELSWDESLRPLLDQAEIVVRRTISRASEFVELQWPADVELDDDPVRASWQLAGVAPLGEIDQITLLRSTSVAQLLARVIDLTDAAGETFTATWYAEEGDDPELGA